MAKKKVSKRTTAAKKPKLSPTDRKTMKSLVGLANDIVKTANRGRAPHLDIPSRSLSNVRYNKTRRFIEMGSGKNRRELFNLAQAKAYMQTVLVAKGCMQLTEQGKTNSIRGLFYSLKGKIKGTVKSIYWSWDGVNHVVRWNRIGLRFH